ncbi:hypothetical protein [Methanofollis fontis]|uniref:Uncharacterized protein n=1 Tax=Methanofollis fontis TaxID=2052832 RepID=A0A483CV76_9EURY|nr:hypothetical protein [Methanofollis fontis]TAJ44877.1 hypothetical protein CUJ86_06225 [Methanofollis fontis]
MTSRTRAHHTTCPYCNEEVYYEELIGGRCPLCGSTLEEPEEGCMEVDDGIERTDLAWLICHYFLFKKLDELGANPLQIMDVISRFDDGDGGAQKTAFEIEVPFGRLERILPKQCGCCRKVFFRGGKKVFSGDAGGTGYTVSFRCPACSQ